MDYMKIAQVVSTSSKCNRKKVGSVIVIDNRIVSTGYNGTPAGACNKCEDENDVTHPFVIHSEANALLNATTHDLRGGIMYVTLSPCLHCAALIIQKGLKAVYYFEEYKDVSGVNYLNTNGVVCIKY